jgi:hypothetical protein
MRFILDLRLPGFDPTHYAVTTLPDRVTVFIAVVEEGGEVVVQQYLLPVGDYRRYPHSDFMHKDLHSIRFVELAQRYYSEGRWIEDEFPDTSLFVEMLFGKWIDPLLGCLAGYSLIRADKQEQFVHVALDNMLRFFADLPDTHVLAGLCNPEHSAEYFGRALDVGLPVFSEGFHALANWFARRDAELPPAMLEPSRGLIASPWTAWISHSNT